MRLRLASILSAAALFAGAFATPLFAQERAGFWIGGGLGVVSTGITIDRDIDRGVGFDTALGVGWTINRQTLVGIELRGGYGVVFYEPDGDVDTYGTDLLAALTYYPRQSSGFFLRTGVGPAFLDDSVSDTPGPDVGAVGFAVLGGAGYDLYLGRNLSLTSTIEFRYGDNGKVEFDDGARYRGLTHNVVGAYVGIKLN